MTEETTEWLYLLGEQERIVGISAYSIRPPEAKNQKPVVSAFINGSISKIKELRPDLVIGFSDIQADLAKRLIETGLNVLIFNQRYLSEIFDTMQFVGNLIGKSAEANSHISKMKKKIEDVNNQTSIRKHRPKVFFQEWDDPIITGITWVSELIEIAGGNDCFREKSRSPLAKDRIVTAEEVSAANPEIILGSWCGKPVDFEWVKNKPEWQNVIAVRENSIYELDPSIILQPGPALFLEGIDKLSELLLKVSPLSCRA